MKLCGRLKQFNLPERTDAAVVSLSYVVYLQSCGQLQSAGMGPRRSDVSKLESKCAALKAKENGRIRTAASVSLF